MTHRDEDLTPDERQFQSEYENGELQSAPNLADRKRELREAGRETLNKTKNINIRLTEKDLNRLKVKAAEEGIPYQTLVSSILHKAVSGYHAEEPAPAYLSGWFKPAGMGKTFEENPNE